MNKINSFIIAGLLLVLFFLEPGCKKDNNKPNNVSQDTLSLEINEFIWQGLNYYYLWTDSVPNLAFSKFPTESSWISFLNQYNTEHSNLFYDLLYKYEKVDRFSWIVDDYVALENSFQGISKSMGYQFGLAYLDANHVNIIGYVMYVLKGSPADKAGIKRGNLFTKVNGQQLTVSNWQSLLDNPSSYTLTFVSGSLVETGTKSITAVELQENPVFLDTVYTVSNHNVGYLVYNGFYSDFDLQLNQAFARFKNKNIDKLVLDLRYNPGGAVESAIYLASMIYSTDASKTFVKYQYNPQLTNDIVSQTSDPSYFSDHLTNNIITYISDTQTQTTPITSLGLSDLYVLTTGNTASASELVINGLKPYIPVTTIGTRTVGKNVGSWTINDRDSTGTINPNHTWAMQPIVFKIANANNFSNYANGIAPNDSIQENLANLLPLGDTNEPLLNDALARIGGTATHNYAIKSQGIGWNSFTSSKALLPHAKEMYSKKNFVPKNNTLREKRLPVKIK